MQPKKTTQQWMQEVKTVPGKLEKWLERQYIGEALAAQRIQTLADTQIGTKHWRILERIAQDEKRHTSWIADLLHHRNIPLPEVTYDGVRYWQPILDNLHTFAEITGAGHHAEAMRLVRIKALAEDTDIAEDIREVFAKILPDEQFHTLAFGKLSTPEAIEKTRTLHKQGLELLGLVI